MCARRRQRKPKQRGRQAERLLEGRGKFFFSFLLRLCLKDDAILSGFYLLEDGGVEPLEVVERRELPPLAAEINEGAALPTKELQHAFQVDCLRGVHVERAHGVALEMGGE